MRRILAAVIVGFALAFSGGCAMFGGSVDSIAVPQSLPDAGKQAASLINEANVLLTALNLTIKDDVEGGIYTKAQAQGYLDKTKAAGAKVDEAQLLLAKGDYSKAISVAQLQKTVLLALQRELAAQARKAK